MINGNVNEFVDRISYGDELSFLYNQEKYFLQGIYENGRCVLYLDRWVPPTDDYIWIGIGDQNSYPVQKFLEAKIWDGKSFWDVEGCIEWVDS
ncbi:MAG: hypothetical protein LUI87_07060 [Lachnospiraceae bacterium]|nr:hypothetical protein [Lachnospiraceae bacterium]